MKNKRLVLYCLLFSLGTIGTIVFIAAGIANPATWWDNQAFNGWFGAILEARASAPFFLFSFVGAVGFLLCALEIFLNDRRR